MAKGNIVEATNVPPAFRFKGLGDATPPTALDLAYQLGQARTTIGWLAGALMVTLIALMVFAPHLPILMARGR